jgi:hypothetical protein
MQSLPTPELADFPPHPPTKTSKVVSGLFNDDRSVSVRNTAECLNVRSYTVCTIVEPNFGKVCIKTVPDSLAMEQKQ